MGCLRYMRRRKSCYRIDEVAAGARAITVLARVPSLVVGWTARLCGMMRARNGRSWYAGVEWLTASFSRYASIRGKQ